MNLSTKIYILANECTRSTAYGIGTYLRQLIECYKCLDLDFDIVFLYSNPGDSINIEQKDGYRIIRFPTIGNPENGTDMIDLKEDIYYRNAAYLLKKISLEANYESYVFHLNIMSYNVLVDKLKRVFNNSCKILLTVHYTDWSLDLLGDIDKLKTIMSKEFDDIKDVTEKRIYFQYKQNIELLKNCDHIIFVAEHTYQMFKEVGGYQLENYSIVRNALLDEYKELSLDEKISLKKKFLIKSDEIIISYAGRVDEIKGVGNLIQAFKLLLNQYENIRLLIIGEGEFSEFLKSADPYWSKITFTGKVDKNILSELYRVTDIGVLPSKHEEFGYVAIEMMMHFVPIIVSDTGGLAEIVEDGLTGMKIPLQKSEDGVISIDIDLLSKSLSQLLENKDILNLFAQNGRKRFLEKFEMQTFLTSMSDVYKIMLV